MISIQLFFQQELYLSTLPIIDRYDDFLRKTLPMIHIKQLRAAILALLAKYPDRINSQLYEILSHNHFVLREAPLEVKRGFFVRDKNMFKDVIGSRVAEYQKDLQLRQMAREIRGAVVVEVLDARFAFPKFASVA